MFSAVATYREDEAFIQEQNRYEIYQTKVTKITDFHFLFQGTVLSVIRKVYSPSL